MNLYDILEALARRNFNGHEQESALEVIAELRQVNALGTLSGTTEAGAHECIPRPTSQYTSVCDICGRPM